MIHAGVKNCHHSKGLQVYMRQMCIQPIGQIQLKEVQVVVQKGRANSSPGPSGLTYAVYKRCPKLLCRLWKLFKAIWIHQRVPEEWNRAEGIYVPKMEKSTVIGVSTDLIAQLWREDILFYCCKEDNRISVKEWVHRHSHTKGGSAWFLWLFGAQQCYYRANNSNSNLTNYLIYSA